MIDEQLKQVSEYGVYISHKCFHDNAMSLFSIFGECSLIIIFNYNLMILGVF